MGIIKSQTRQILLVIITVQIETKVIKISNQTLICNRIKAKEILFWQIKAMPILIPINDFNIMSQLI